MTKKFTPRQQRVLDALLKAKDWVWRESIDKIAKASNGPEVIRQLRHTFKIDIDMEQVEITDSDGRSASPGRYRLTDSGRSKVFALLGHPTLF